MGWLSRLFRGRRDTEVDSEQLEETDELEETPKEPYEESYEKNPEESAETPEAATPQLPPEQRELEELIESLERDPDRAFDLLEQAEAVASRALTRHRTRRSADLLRRLCPLMPHATSLQFLLAELLYDLKEHAEAVSLLEDLLDAPAHRVQAHFMLGDYHGQQADLRTALRHYEAVLALDFNHPRARGRADDLRNKLDRPVATSAPTILGVEDLGPGSRFLLQRELGRGGGGIVYLAQDKSLGRPVAVKALHPHVVQRQETRAHLFCEARIAAALHHPGIVTIYDLDETLNLVVMEYCAGGALADRIAGGPLPAELALSALAEVTVVLEVVHRCGVVHRDLKPANLLLRGRDSRLEPGTMVLTDFGIAHAGVEGATEETAAGSLIYMAPEQRRAGEVDARADLYACGVILIEMLLGHPPLTRQQALQGVLLHDLTPLWDELEANVPPLLAGSVLALCQDLVSPAPDDRPAEAALVTGRTTALIARCEELGLLRSALRELEDRAGPPPRSPEVQRWLDEQTRALETATKA